VVAFASSLDQVGVFARNVGDCAAVSQVLFGKDPRDATSVDRPVPDLVSELGGSIKGLRIGIPKEYFIPGLDAEIKSAVDSALRVFESLGATVVQISLPHTELAVATYYIIAPAEASSNLARYDGIRYGTRTKQTGTLEEMYARTRGEGFGIEPKRRILIGSYVLSSGYYDAYYLKAQKCRTLLVQDFSNAFATQCDVIASPTAPTPPFKIGEKAEDPMAMYLADVFTIPVNLAGLPGVSIPCGLSKERLPIGLQLIGKPFDETGLLKVAAAFEGATEWHKQRPVKFYDAVAGLGASRGGA
jgi:aspartyl-tRNA(Asn)/glutamyl-tRNA(Gln) amidotransferase subunit A